MNDFRTFCHISEYGEWGYANLHRMVAMSEPLYLWAPSTQLIKDRSCRISEKTFVRLVEMGRVRIVAREWWFGDRQRRDRHPWEGAHWNSSIDDALSAMAREDAEREADDRRVLIADPETGDRNATALIDAVPEVVGQLEIALNAPDADVHFPRGVIETAHRHAGNPRALAEHVLRDAFNHGDAIELAAPRAPFLLGGREAQYFNLLDRVVAGRLDRLVQNRQVGVTPLSDTRLPAGELGALTQEILGILASLENGKPVRLDRFLAGPGHSALATWVDQQCQVAASGDGGYRPGEPTQALRDAVDEGEFFGDGRSALLDLRQAGALGGPGLTAADLGPDGMLSFAAGAGMAIDLITLLADGLKVLGYLPADYSGIRWPYLFAFSRRSFVGSDPTRLRREMIRVALDSLDTDT